MADRLPNHRDVLKRVCEENLGGIMLKPEQSEAIRKGCFCRVTDRIW